MNDREFLEWVAARLVRQGDSPYVDFVGKLCSIARAIPAKQYTSNQGPDEKQMRTLREVDDEVRSKKS